MLITVMGGSGSGGKAGEDMASGEEKLASLCVSASGGALYRDISLRAHVRAADRVPRLQGH